MPRNAARRSRGNAAQEALGLEAVDHAAHGAAIVVHEAAQLACRTRVPLEHVRDDGKLGGRDFERSDLFVEQKLFVDARDHRHPHLAHERGQAIVQIHGLRIGSGAIAGILEQRARGVAAEVKGAMERIGQRNGRVIERNRALRRRCRSQFERRPQHPVQARRHASRHDRGRAQTRGPPAVNFRRMTSTSRAS